LACVTLPTDPDDIQNAVDNFYSDVMNKTLLLNVEYRVGSQEYVSLLFSDNKEDVVQGLVSEGFLLAEKRRERRLGKLVDAYMKAQDKAKKARVGSFAVSHLAEAFILFVFRQMNLWQYGDFTADDAKEFGYQT
jgi:staphylococcal nuclease domain-containing protein 1